MELKGRTALVTGGALRIGRSLCEALAARGCDVVIHCNHSEAEAKDLAAELRRKVHAHVVRGHLGSQEECEAVFQKACKCAGEIEILVNNAAVFHKDSLMDLTEEKLRAEWDSNVAAPILLTQAFARRVLLTREMAAEDEAEDGQEGMPIGKVVNLLDRRLTSNEAGCLPYLLSKKMLAEFTRNAALELAPHITVNGVAPGAVLAPPGEGTEYLRDWAGTIPLKRRCTAEDVAAAMIYLLESDGITGQVVFVDGGQHLLGTAAG